MGIGPIAGIRPITMVKPASSAPDLAGVFAIEFRGQDQQESYSPSQQSAARGLEDEEPDQELLVQGDEDTRENALFDSQQHAAPRNKVSFFA